MLFKATLVDVFVIGSFLSAWQHCFCAQTRGRLARRVGKLSHKIPPSLTLIIRKVAVKVLNYLWFAVRIVIQSK